MIMDTPRVDEMAAFMAERHRIYLRRKAGEPGPWTEDPVLRAGRFCNIFRELDTVTLWIDEHIRKPYADNPHLWFMLCIARYINWPPTLATLIELAEERNVPCWPSHPAFECGEESLAQGVSGFDASDLTWALTNMANDKRKVYTGAYMIRAESSPSVHWYSWSKHKYIAEIVLGRLWEDREEWAAFLEPDVSDARDQIAARESLRPTLEEVWDKFQQKRYIGWGPFMAYEVVTDLRHTRYLRNAKDIYHWANAGPGAIRGLNRLYGRDLNAKPKATQTNLEMCRLMHDLNAYPGERFWDVFGPLKNREARRFEMRDIEHSLCEFDKYERVKRGEGKMRAKYDWTKATKLA